MKVGEVLGPGVLCLETPITRLAFEAATFMDGINMLLERLSVAKPLGAETTFDFVSFRIDMLLQSLKAAKRLFAPPTRYGLRRGSKALLLLLLGLWATRWRMNINVSVNNLCTSLIGDCSMVIEGRHFDNLFEVLCICATKKTRTLPTQ